MHRHTIRLSFIFLFQQLNACISLSFLQASIYHDAGENDLANRFGSLACKCNMVAIIPAIIALIVGVVVGVVVILIVAGVITTSITAR